MRLFKKKFYNNLIKQGYNEEEANIIISGIDNYGNDILNYMLQPGLTIENMKSIIKFYGYKDEVIKFYISKLNEEKRIIIMEAYNSVMALSGCETPSELSDKYIKAWRIIYDVACKYDTILLKSLINKSLVPSSNIDILSTVRTAMESNVSLYDLNIFNDLNLKQANIK